MYKPDRTEPPATGFAISKPYYGYIGLVLLGVGWSIAAESFSPFFIIIGIGMVLGHCFSYAHKHDIFSS